MSENPKTCSGCGMDVREDWPHTAADCLTQQLSRVQAERDELFSNLRTTWEHMEILQAELAAERDELFSDLKEAWRYVEILQAELAAEREKVKRLEEIVAKLHTAASAPPAEAKPGEKETP